MYCTNCGFKMGNSDIYCSNCGGIENAPPAPDNQAYTDPYQQTSQVDYQQQTYQQAQQPDYQQQTYQQAQQTHYQQQQYQQTQQPDYQQQAYQQPQQQHSAPQYNQSGAMPFSQNVSAPSHFPGVTFENPRIDMIKKQAVRFKRSRHNLLAVVAFTALNLLLLSFDFDLNFLFSAFVPQFVFIFLDVFSNHALIIALLCTSVYLILFFLTKRWRVFILIALILFIADTLIMIFFIFSFSLYSEFIFNILFHGWILFYLFTGTVAWAKLRRVTPDEFKAVLSDVTKSEKTEEVASAIGEIKPKQPDNTTN